MNIFKKINEAEVESNDGFKIKYGKDSLTYTCGDRYLIVPIEHVNSPYELHIYIEKVSGWMQLGQSLSDIGEDDLEVVEKRIGEGLTFLKRNYFIVRNDLR